MEVKVSDLKLLVDLAAKAPSGHNTQPWIFRVKGSEGLIRIIPDFTRELTVVDREHRELFISLGCAVENLCIGAIGMGYDPEVMIGEQEIKIRLVCKPSAKKTLHPLYSQIAKRQTNRSVYDSSLIPDDTIQLLRSISLELGVHTYFWKKHTEVFNMLREYVAEGNNLQMNNDSFVTELKSWMRYNKKHAEQSMDGLSYAVFGAPNLPLFLSRSIIGLFLNANTQNKTDMKKIESSSHLLLFTIESNSVEKWISLGRSLQRVLLTMACEGIANAYINQPCEANGLSVQMQEVLPIHHEYPVILLRLGYAGPAPYSMRRSIDEICSFE